MKESDTPLGKAYAKAKAKGAGAPPPPPPLEKGAGGDNADVATRRYKTLNTSIPGDKTGAFQLKITYDNVKNAVLVNVQDNKTQKSVYKDQWNQVGEAGTARSVPLNESKVRASIGRAVTALNRNPLTPKFNQDDIDTLYEKVIDLWSFGNEETEETYDA
jgi:hypothetical protein